MSEKKQFDLKALLEGYYKGTLSELQRKLLDRFFQDSYAETPWNTETMGDRDAIKKTIHKNIHRRTKKKVFRLTPIYYAAASVAILLGLLYFSNKDVENLQFTTTTQIDSLRLADGSKIILSPHSIFAYPKTFNGNLRKVQLIKGNAFFQVARDTAHPFIVTQGNLTTRVLGTSFNVRMTSVGTSVDVKSGKVEVATESGQRQILTKDQQVVFYKEDQSLQQRELSDLPNWYGRNISLNDINLRQLSRFLQLRYGYTLALADPELYNHRLTVNVTAKDDIHSVVSQLKYITNLQFKINAHEISVHEEK